MARPKAFDRDTAAQAAIEVFWTKGFAGASTEDLTAAMGIGRQSLYDTFGDKRRLYLEALTRYNTENVAGHLAALRDGGSATQAIEALLLRFANEPDDRRVRGRASTPSASSARTRMLPPLANPAARSLAHLTRLVESGQLQGDVAAAIDPQSAARFIAATLAGLKVQPRLWRASRGVA